MDAPVIFLVSHSSPGGVQEIWRDLSDGFSAAGQKAILLALYPPDADEIQDVDHEGRWQYVVNRRPRRPAQFIKMIFALTQIIKEHSPSLLITAMPAANIIAIIASKICRNCCPVIISHHTPVSSYSKKLNLIDSIVGGSSNVVAIVSVSDGVASSLAGKGARYLRKRRTIHNALPPHIEAFLSEVRRRRNRVDVRPRSVISIGRLADQKNHPMLLRAAARIDDLSVDIVGDGPDRAKLEQLIEELGLQDRVRLLGQMQRKEALKHLSHGNIFVQMSLFEGHSLALLEAAKLGLPLVVSDAPTQVEAVTARDGTACGIIVAQHDDKALADRLAELLDDKALRDTWAHNAAVLGDEITFAGMIQSYLSLVDEFACA